MIRFLLLNLITLHFIFSLSAQGEREITLEEIFYTPSFAAQTVRGMNFLKSGDYAVLERSFYGMPNIIQYETSSGIAMDTIFRGRMLLPDGAERPIAFDSYVLSKDESKILLACNMTRQYRHS